MPTANVVMGAAAASLPWARLTEAACSNGPPFGTPSVMSTRTFLPPAGSAPDGTKLSSAW